MNKKNRLRTSLFPLLTLLAIPFSFAGNLATEKATIDNIVQPLIQKHAIPGMAIAVSVNGQQHFYNYGVSSKQTGSPITNETLFEIGSLSKTFTATLAAYAQNEGKLSFSDPASNYLPELKNTAFDNVTLLNLATHTSGLPLFVPDSVTNTTQLMDYYRNWAPTHKIGTYRVYSNLGVGMLGIATARSFNRPFNELMEKELIPALGLKHTYISVPTDEMENYAQGYNKSDKPVRVNPAPLDAESYGIKSSTADLIRYLEANMQLVDIAPQWQKALNNTHIAHYKAGEITQNLMWESYAYPVKLNKLIAGNNAGMIMNGMPATAITEPSNAQTKLWFNKTGSTNGFSTYAVFIPSQKTAIVILANKWFPNDERVEAAYKIVQALEQ